MEGARVVVLIEWGPRGWQKALIPPGGRLRVGRLERADLVVAHDEDISGLHFELAWDGVRCLLRDLSSTRGTVLNGERVEAGEVGHGDWVQAGSTVFSVYIEGVAPPWTPRRGAPRVAAQRKAEALAALRAETAPLYAVLDAAREERVLTWLRCSPDRARSLYEGSEGEALADVAPYLVQLHESSWLLDRLVHDGWGEGWGIYLTCHRPFTEVRRQLRRLLVVEIKVTAELLYFRFYDPNVLAVAVDLCKPRQVQAIFGEIESFVVEGEAGEVLRLRAQP